MHILKLVSVNIEGDKHFQRLMPFFAKEAPDVMCLQEVYEADLPMLAQRLSGTYVFAANAFIDEHNPFGHAAKGRWGIAIIIRNSWPVTFLPPAYYVGSAATITPMVNPLSLNRSLLVAQLNVKNIPLTIATTHFTWTPDGRTDDRQRRDLTKLLALLIPHQPLILCGDFNAPRGQAIHATLSEEYIDYIPKSVTSTIDPELHRLGATVHEVIDGLFASPTYKISDVRIVSGVSDHQAVTAAIALQDVAAPAQ